MSRVRARVEQLYRDLNRRTRAADADNEIEVVLITLEPDEHGVWPELPDGRVTVVYPDGRVWREGS